MPIAFEDHPFWDFSLAVYGAEGVSTACIALQERHGLDVNVLLFCVWIGASGRGRLTPDELGAGMEAVADWNSHVVCGLRAVRRWMRPARAGIAGQLADQLRRQIADIEVQCEHAEQLALANAVKRPKEALPSADQLDAAIANCRLYLARRGATVTGTDHADLARILAAAIPTVEPETIAQKLKKLADR